MPTPEFKIKRLAHITDEAEFLARRHSRLKEAMRVVRIAFEFIRGFRAFHFLPPAVTVFGSARYKEGHSNYELAREIGPDTEFTGSLLRKVRESQGIEIAEISSRTKISKQHLAALEEETYDQLPAIVYVRGFVTELAKYLRLDPAQVQRTYLRRMREKPASS